MTAGGAVAVVGGGIFGCTAAIALARAGYRVTLFERHANLMLEASYVNQRRLHWGYHYPRSRETAMGSLRGLQGFLDEYAEVVETGGRRYVAIAREGSKVSAEEYVRFCDSLDLPYWEEMPPFLDPALVEISLRVKEYALDIDRLRQLVWSRLVSLGVDVRLGSPAAAADLDPFDQVVLATYASINRLAPPSQARRFQFEVCEKPVVHLPPAYHDVSVIIMDGPFMCVDPLPGSDAFLCGNVTHALHATTVGIEPLVPRHILPYLNVGITTPPAWSRFDRFVGSARPYLRGFEHAKHLGSMFTIRTVMADVEATDRRPSVVRRLGPRIVSVFGGKMGTCVEAADDVVRSIDLAAETAVAHAAVPDVPGWR